MSNLRSDEFVDFKVFGPDGKEVPWRGKSRIASKEYSPSDFAVLEGYQEISAKRVISLKDGAGFVFDKPGQYSVTAEYSLEPPEYFAPFAGKTKVPAGSFRSEKAAFCVEACILEPLQVRNNTSQSALAAYAFSTRPSPNTDHWTFLRGAQRRPLGPSSANGSSRSSKTFRVAQTTTTSATAIFSKQTNSNPRLHGWRMACSPGQTKRQVR